MDATEAMKEECPTLWILAVKQEQNERIGWQSSELENEAAP